MLLTLEVNATHCAKNKRLTYITSVVLLKKNSFQ